MGHRQNMTPKQRLKWDFSNYKKKLKSNKNSNYEYWTKKHDKMLENGWSQLNFKDLDQCFDIYTKCESVAKEKVIKLRNSGNYARIVCISNRLRIKTYSVIFKPKKAQPLGFK